MKKTIYSLLFLLPFISCTPEGRVFNENQKLSPKLEWTKDDIKTFFIPNLEKEKNYKLSVTFRYATGYVFDKLKVKITTIAPNGEELSKEYYLTVRNENGEYIGEPALDIWDSMHEVESQLRFPENGNYSFKIEHQMDDDPLDLAMEIGLILDEVN